MKCILCNQRKGKRFCPAKHTMICAQCCGTKRIVEIDCPTDCVYLREGQQYQAAQKYARQFRSYDPAKQILMQQVATEFPDVLELLERVLAQAGRLHRSLRDRDALEAIAVLLKNYETESSGVLYDRRADSLDAQMLLEDLRKILEARRAEIDPTVRRLTVVDALKCLRMIQYDIDYHAAHDSSERSYLDFTVRMYPDAGRSGGERSSGLILP